MADRYLVDAIAAGGVDHAAAEEMAERVAAAVLAQLREGRGVTLPGVGRLIAPEKGAWVPGHHGKLARRQRKVRLLTPAIVAQSDPYEPLPAERQKLTISPAAGSAR